MSSGFFSNINQQLNMNTASSDWRLTLSNEERKSNISKHFKFLNTNYNNSQSFIASKKWEDDAYNSASSKDEYYQIIAAKIQSYERAQQQQRQQQEQEQQQQLQLQQNQQTETAASRSTDWHLTLSDEERKANLIVLFRLFEDLNTKSNKSNKDLSFNASKKWEDDAYNNANSKDEYNRIIAAKMQLIKRSIIQTQEQQQEQEQEQEQEQQQQQLQLQQNQQTEVAASCSTDWHLTLSDEERKANTKRLFMLLQATKLNVNQRFIHSKKCEDDAYNKASSKNEYNQILAEKMRSILQLLKKSLQQQLLNQILRQQQTEAQSATSCSTEWHLTLSDEERKANTKRLFVLTRVFNTILNVNQRFIVSKQWENDAFKKASSKDEYNNIIIAKILLVKHAQQKQRQSLRQLFPQNQQQQQQ